MSIVPVALYKVARSRADLRWLMYMATVLSVPDGAAGRPHYAQGRLAPVQSADMPHGT